MIITDIEKLKIKSEKVDLLESESIILSLERELDNSASLGKAGIGLSAPQIGIYKRVVIIRIPSTGYKKCFVNLVNPVITASYDKALFTGEGCLSFPGMFEKTYRFQEIVVENDIEPYKFIATGLFAVCIQHEIDHLDGIVLPEIAIKKS